MNTIPKWECWKENFNEKCWVCSCYKYCKEKDKVRIEGN